MSHVAILDIDGTLVDTNYHHAIAWHRALRQHDVTVPVWRVHRHIGMGGDKLVAAVAGDEVEKELGDDIRDAEKALYMAMIEEVQPFEGARDLIMDLNERTKVVLASSAKPEEVDHYLDQLEARDLVAAWTTAADVEATKPEPDLVQAALDAVGADEGILIGDTPWDVKAASRASVPTIAVLTGGFSQAELEQAGAARVFDSIASLRAELDRLPLPAAA